MQFKLSALLLLAPLVVQGISLRGSRMLEEENVEETCIPAGSAPFSKVAYVSVDLAGEDAFNATTFNILDLATSFGLSYNGLVDCAFIRGSVREVGTTNALTEAVNLEDTASHLLRVEIFCNACGDDVELFSSEPPTTFEEPLEDVADVICACDGPFQPAFVELYNDIFSTTTILNIQVDAVNQLDVLDCPPQNFTTFNSTSVCLGPDAFAFQDDATDIPSSAPTVFP